VIAAAGSCDEPDVPLGSASRSSRQLAAPLEVAGAPELVAGEAPGLIDASVPEENTREPGACDLRALFEAYHGSVWRLLRRFGVHASRLDDAAQEVFWVAARRLQDIQPGKEQAFLYGVALRIASNTARRERVALPLAEQDAVSLLTDDQPSPEAQAEQREARRLLDGVLEQLPGELSSVLVLFEIEGLALRDIAAIEGIPIGTVSSRLRRAREEFSAIVKRLRAGLAGPGRRTPWR
jgi:RNA polymerase sigma-70 factor (ECF subfamily)